MDYIKGAESDSGLTLHVTCPACRQPHVLALTRLDGRFMYSCTNRHLAGQVAQWHATRDLAKAANGQLQDRRSTVHG